jgi:uncharacterized repeat protein (TIGR04138 family)
MMTGPAGALPPPRLALRRPAVENRSDFYDTIDAIVDRDPRYRPEAYSFVMLALGFTVAQLEAPRHVTGQELSEGIRRYAIEQFGPMARTVFEHWGVRETQDFGHIVFNLIGAGLLGRTDTDRLEDFAGVYDFETVFVRDYPWGVAAECAE